MFFSKSGHEKSSLEKICLVSQMENNKYMDKDILRSELYNIIILVGVSSEHYFLYRKDLFIRIVETFINDHLSQQVILITQ